MPVVAQHADDRRPWLLVPADANTLPDRIAAAKAMEDHLLVDEHHGVERVAIRVGEPPAAEELHADRGKVAGSDVLPMRNELLTALRRRRPFDLRLCLQVPPAERYPLRRRRHRDAWLAPEARQQVVIEEASPRAGVSRTGQRHPRGKNSLLVEA